MVASHQPRLSQTFGLGKTQALIWVCGANNTQGGRDVHLVRGLQTCNYTNYHVDNLRCGLIFVPLSGC